MNQWLLEELNRNPDITLVRFDVDQYERLAESGIIPEEVRCELWDGLIVYKDSADTAADRASIGVRYAGIMNSLHRYLTQCLLDSNWSVSCRSPIELNRQHAPEPDLAIIRGDRSDYFPTFPGPEVVQLVVEIVEATLPQRFDFLLSSYAAQAVPEIWFVKLQTDELEVHDRPQRELNKYAQCRTFKADESVKLNLPGRDVQSLSVRAILDATLK